MPAKDKMIGHKGAKPEWYPSILQHQRPDRKKALWQLFTTLNLFALSWCLMVLNLRWDQNLWLHFGLVMVTAGLQVRIFIIFHDCCHQAFFASHRANTIIGHICGVLTYTPYQSWRRIHGIHHNTVCDLDRRSRGDVWTLTLEEYINSSGFKRIQYRLFRNPVIMLILGPAYLFLIEYRFPGKGDRRKQINSLHLTNAGIVAMMMAAAWLIGWPIYLLIQVPIALIAGASGIWLFYIQHHFEGVYRARHPEWDPMKAALEGSSFYQLPSVLQWFSGNIGFHHIHHVCPRIPNYHLSRCQDVMAPWHTTAPLKLRGSLRSLRLKLWDEKRNRFVGFDAIKTHG